MASEADIIYTMNTAKSAKGAAKFTLDQFETLAAQTTPQLKPFVDEAKDELFGFFSSPKIGGRPRELVREDLKRAREQEKLQKEKSHDESSSKAKVKEIMAMYKESRSESKSQENELRQEMHSLESEVAQLAKTAGVETKLHLKNTPKVGKIDLSFLTFIIRTLRVKAESSKSAKSLVSERSEIKSTGMNAWVSGKQMKIHEQGTLQLQG